MELSQVQKVNMFWKKKKVRYWR